MTVVAEFDIKHQAEAVLNAFTGELGARYDPITGKYTYNRDGQERQVWLSPRTATGWQLIIEGEEDAVRRGTDGGVNVPDPGI